MKNKVSPEYAQLKKVISRYVDKYPVPTRKENQKNLEHLIELKKNIDDPVLYKEYQNLRSHITLCNGGFGMRYVLKYYSLLNSDASISELFQETVIALLESIDTFDLSKNTSFTTYAFFHIKKRIIDFIKKNKLVRAPRDIARNLKHVNVSLEKLTGELTRGPDTAEVTQDLEEKGILLKREMVDNIVNLLELNSGSNNETFISEFNDQVHTNEANKEDIFNRMKLLVLSDLEMLQEEESKLLKLRFGLTSDGPHSPRETTLLLK